MLTPSFVMAGLGIALGALVMFILLRRRGLPTPPERVITSLIADRVASVGKLVALEVNAKEIATATQGWAWMPPLVLSQARLAMIFQFEQQFTIDLSAVSADHVTEAGVNTDGRRRYVVELPSIEASLRLTDVVPYDIQHGKVMGLLDVIPMNASRQSDLMRRAQDDAQELFGDGDRYREAARGAAERQMRSLLGLFDADVEIVWREPAAPALAGSSETVEEADATPAVKPKNRRLPSIARAKPAARPRRRPVSA